MKIVVTGGTGFLGAALCHALVGDGHQLTVLTRREPEDRATAKDGLTWFGWAPDHDSGAWPKLIDGADAVVNLAGESIAARRW